MRSDAATAAPLVCVSTLSIVSPWAVTWACVSTTAFRVTVCAAWPRRASTSPVKAVSRTARDAINSGLIYTSLILIPSSLHNQPALHAGVLMGCDHWRGSCRVVLLEYGKPLGGCR